MSHTITTNNLDVCQTWNNVQWEIVAPAIAEAETILDIQADKNPGWCGNNRIYQGNRIVEIHDFRRPFSFWDAWSYWNPPTQNHYHYYSQPADYSNKADRREEEGRKKDEGMSTFMRIAVAVVAGVGLYYTSKSLGYAAGQYFSAEKKMSQMQNLNISYINTVIQDEKILGLSKVIELRNSFMNEAKTRNFYDMVSYISVAAGFALMALSAAFASYGLLVTGAVIGTAGLVFWAFSHTCLQAMADDPARKRQAETMLSESKKLASIKVEYFTLPPTYQSVYPDINQIQRDHQKSWHNDNSTYKLHQD